MTFITNALFFIIGALIGYFFVEIKEIILNIRKGLQKAIARARKDLNISTK